MLYDEENEYTFGLPYFTMTMNILTMLYDEVFLKMFVETLKII